MTRFCSPIWRPSRVLVVRHGGQIAHPSHDTEVARGLPWGKGGWDVTEKRRAAFRCPPGAAAPRETQARKSPWPGAHGLGTMQGTVEGKGGLSRGCRRLAVTQPRSAPRWGRGGQPCAAAAPEAPPTTSKGNGIANVLGIGTSIASLATMIATISNLVK